MAMHVPPDTQKLLGLTNKATQMLSAAQLKIRWVLIGQPSRLLRCVPAKPIEMCLCYC